MLHYSLRVLLGILLGFYFIGCSPYTRVTPVDRNINYDKSHFKKFISIKDDEFETDVEINTLNGHKPDFPTLTKWWTDVFLRGFVNKTSGEKEYQVYVRVVHRKESWLTPYQVNYGTPLKTSETIARASDVDCTGSKYFGCTYFENFGFMVDESELRRIQVDTSQSVKGLQFKVKCKNGDGFIESLPKTEIEALLEVMDNYKFIKTR